VTALLAGYACIGVAFATHMLWLYVQACDDAFVNEQIELMHEADVDEDMVVAWLLNVHAIRERHWLAEVAWDLIAGVLWPWGVYAWRHNYWARIKQILAIEEGE